MKENIKKIGSFIKKWSDVLLVLPVTGVLILTNTLWARQIDPTSNVMDAGFIVVLNFNIVKYMAVMVLAYFIAQNYFKFDIFSNGWQSRMKNPVVAAILSFLIWLSILIPAIFIITKDL